MAKGWVKRFAEEERRRDVSDRREVDALEHEADAVRAQNRALLDALRAQVARDVRAFAREFPDRAITFEPGPLDGGFIVRRGHYPEVDLTVAPTDAAATISVQYLLASGSGTLAPKPRELVVAGHDADAAHFRDEEGQQAFLKIEQLSEYLLVPVFTGRLREAPGETGVTGASQF